MCVLLVVFLSTIVLHSVSAGGVYCAKTARARAAALGLDYPGVHGAPDLLGPAHLGIPLPHSNEWAENEPNMFSYQQNQPPFDDLMHKQANPRTSGFLLRHGTYKPVQRDYTTNSVRSFPRGWSVSNRKPSFKEVKHAALPTLAEAPGQFDLVSRDPQGPSFVYNKHDLVVESAPNGHGIFQHALPLPRSWGHGAYQSGLTVYGLGRKVPVLGSKHFINKGHKALTSRGSPVFGGWRYRFPGLSAKQFVQGKPILVI